MCGKQDSLCIKKLHYKSIFLFSLPLDSFSFISYNCFANFTVFLSNNIHFICVNVHKIYSQKQQKTSETWKPAKGKKKYVLHVAYMHISPMEIVKKEFQCVTITKISKSTNVPSISIKISSSSIMSIDEWALCCVLISQH